ncbi:class I SAM-dependent methyltransferase [Marivivens donghaensis]|uniref:class I SAM-dependent methyltransferase n=1 Tax=Marivivens donghaensis TaxID=1699413 RepID=UPI00201EA34A|nr:SAM-dependent methyltransferase [Marivivens donghaensis]MCL7407733.1 SAM-dependent methyltransferase [Marivivens donghaensis]MDN3704288.1 SAM-dependent methyltransferase [Marivivens donghaensis]
MTALADLLKRRIAATGPITLADYMSEALLHPEHGYYTTRDPLGATGDFVTSPEISQMFGEMIGLCLAQAWIDQGRPNGVLAELGPGRGTLMQDILRATKGVAGFHDALDLHLVEASPVLRAAQSARLPNPTFHADVSTLPNAPLFLVANEFFDALPVRQFQRDGTGWRERMVGLEGDTLTIGLSAAAPIALLDHRLADTKDGDLVEVCPALPAIMGQIGEWIGTRGGAALIIDYGDWRSQGDTLQALRGHKPVDPLDAPGTADLTTHVDFEVITQSAAPARFTRITPQGVFLERLGITQRAQSLAQSMSGDALESHIAAHRRLTHPSEMGDLFKVVGIYPDAHTPPAGLEP